MEREIDPVGGLELLRSIALKLQSSRNDAITVFGKLAGARATRAYEIFADISSVVDNTERLAEVVQKDIDLEQGLIGDD